MDFPAIAQAFAAADSGSDAFKTLYKDVFALMQTDPANAALYFVIGTAAQAFVRQWEDQEITAAFADRAKAILMRYNATLAQALAAPADERLRLMGEVAIDYEWAVRDF